MMKTTNRTQDTTDRKQRKKPAGPAFKKVCNFCKKEQEIDYKNLELMSNYVSSKGKIVSRRISGNCAKHQRKVAREIKRARFLALLPYVGN
ncbi:MAG: 30S ribosomal protein S18 [Candidatus Omnitrophica bacterium]|nr:30S ribosomal protein S18 [Candidatus Omnitrophota bacterium]